jgi:hypothetical protein
MTAALTADASTGGGGGGGEGHLPEEVLLQRFRDACIAVQLLHSQAPQPICHYDLKPENLLLASGPGGRAVAQLCDFGSAVVGWTPLETEAQRSEAEDRIERTTTLAYRAPELCDVGSILMLHRPGERRVGPPADVWALGCLLYRLAFHATPFEDGSGVVQRMAIINGRYAIPPASPYSPLVPALIAACLVANPDGRPSVARLLEMAAGFPMFATLPPPVTPEQWSAWQRAGGRAGSTTGSPAAGSSAAAVGAGRTFGGGGGAEQLGAGYGQPPASSISRARASSGATPRASGVSPLASVNSAAGGGAAGLASSGSGSTILSAVMTTLESASETLQSRLMQVLSVGRRGTRLDKRRWVLKATSLVPSGPKPKYVRRLVLDAWERSSAGAAGKYLPQRPLTRQPIVALKAAILALKLVQQGPVQALAQLAGAQDQPAGDTEAPLPLHPRESARARDRGLSEGGSQRPGSALAPAAVDDAAGFIPLFDGVARYWQGALPQALVDYIHGRARWLPPGASRDGWGSGVADNRRSSSAESASVPFGQGLEAAIALKHALGALLAGLPVTVGGVAAAAAVASPTPGSAGAGASSPWQPAAAGPDASAEELFTECWRRALGRVAHAVLPALAVASVAGRSPPGVLHPLAKASGAAHAQSAAAAAVLAALAPPAYAPDPAAVAAAGGAPVPEDAYPLEALAAAASVLVCERLRLAQRYPTFGPAYGLDTLAAAVVAAKTAAGGSSSGLAGLLGPAGGGGGGGGGAAPDPLRAAVGMALVNLPVTASVWSSAYPVAFGVLNALLALLAATLRTCLAALQVDGLAADLPLDKAPGITTSRPTAGGRAANVSLDAMSGAASKTAGLVPGGGGSSGGPSAGGTPTGSASQGQQQAAPAAAPARSCAVGALGPLVEEAWSLCVVCSLCALLLRHRLRRESAAAAQQRPGAASAATLRQAALQTAGAAALVHACTAVFLGQVLRRYTRLQGHAGLAPFCEPLEERMADTTFLSQLPHFMTMGDRPAESLSAGAVVPSGAAGTSPGLTAAAVTSAAGAAAPGVNPAVEMALGVFGTGVSASTASADVAGVAGRVASVRGLGGSDASAAAGANPSGPPPPSPYLAPDSTLAALLRLSDAEVGNLSQAALLRRACSVPGNEACAECGAPDVTWASVNLGVTLCLNCSGAHRQLGVHISQVRSLTLDRWKAPWLRALLAVGNRRSNAFWEAKGRALAQGVPGVAALPMGRPSKDASVEERYRWTTLKYTRATWAADAQFAGAPEVAAKAAQLGVPPQSLSRAPHEALPLRLAWVAAGGAAAASGAAGAVAVPAAGPAGNSNGTRPAIASTVGAAASAGATAPSVSFGDFDAGAAPSAGTAVAESDQSRQRGAPAAAAAHVSLASFDTPAEGAVEAGNSTSLAPTPPSRSPAAAAVARAATAVPAASAGARPLPQLPTSPAAQQQRQRDVTPADFDLAPPRGGAVPAGGAASGAADGFSADGFAPFAGPDDFAFEASPSAALGLPLQSDPDFGFADAVGVSAGAALVGGASAGGGDFDFAPAPAASLAATSPHGRLRAPSGSEEGTSGFEDAGSAADPFALSGPATSAADPFALSGPGATRAAHLSTQLEDLDWGSSPSAAAAAPAAAAAAASTAPPAAAAAAAIGKATPSGAPTRRSTVRSPAAAAAVVGIQDDGWGSSSGSSLPSAGAARPAALQAGASFTAGLDWGSSDASSAFAVASTTTASETASALSASFGGSASAARAGSFTSAGGGLATTATATSSGVAAATAGRRPPLAPSAGRVFGVPSLTPAAPARPLHAPSGSAFATGLAGSLLGDGSGSSGGDGGFDDLFSSAPASGAPAGTSGSGAWPGALATATTTASAGLPGQPRAGRPAAATAVTTGRLGASRGAVGVAPGSRASGFAAADSEGDSGVDDEEEEEEAWEEGAGADSSDSELEQPGASPLHAVGATAGASGGSSPRRALRTGAGNLAVRDSTAAGSRRSGGGSGSRGRAAAADAAAPHEESELPDATVALRIESLRQQAALRHMRSFSSRMPTAASSLAAAAAAPAADAGAGSAAAGHAMAPQGIGGTGAAQLRSAAAAGLVPRGAHATQATLSAPARSAPIAAPVRGAPSSALLSAWGGDDGDFSFGPVGGAPAAPGQRSSTTGGRGAALPASPLAPASASGHKAGEDHPSAAAAAGPTADPSALTLQPAASRAVPRRAGADGGLAAAIAAADDGWTAAGIEEAGTFNPF